jgi:hypothetical protein
MKLIGCLQGFAVFRAAMEEVVPEKVPPISVLTQFIASTYSFVSFPVIRPGTDLPATLNFAGGGFPEKGNQFSITQLIMSGEADLAVTSSAHQSDLFLNHLTAALSENFGYRFQSTRITKTYVSNIVVEFDRGIEEYLSKLSRMETAIHKARDPNLPRLRFKRLGFGAKGGAVPESDPFTAVQEAEFLIERRAGIPFNQNRYFCSAPMITADHIRTLEEVEEIATA